MYNVDEERSIPEKTTSFLELYDSSTRATEA